MALVTQKLVKFLGFNTFIMEALKSYEFEFKQVISNRIAHCNGQLKNNEVIAEDDNFFFFKNGEHYSKPVMEALKEALVQNIEHWNSLIWQQIVRQLWEDDSRDKNLFYIATESLLVAK